MKCVILHENLHQRNEGRKNCAKSNKMQQVISTSRYSGQFGYWAQARPTFLLFEFRIRRVSDLSNPQHRFKVDVNAQQYHLTGGVVLCKEDDINVVIVEGGKKAVRHYTRLMTRRIRWNDSADDENSDCDDNDSPVKSNGCVLVWEGIVGRRAFNTFRFQECRTRTTARKVMDTKNVGNYWDLVENSIN